MFERGAFPMFTTDFFSRYFQAASIFFAAWSAYTLIKQMIAEKSVLLKRLPKNTLRLAGIGLVLTFLSQWLRNL